jgi:putative polyketide hydroxylase
VLLAGIDGEEVWVRVAQDAAHELGVALESLVVGGTELTDPERVFFDAYGLSGAGAVLVRPDGVVGWRSVNVAGGSAGALREALRRLLCRRHTAVSPAVTSPV